MLTGYFAKLKTYVGAGLVPVSVAGKAPAWYNGLEYKKLAPKWEFFNEWKNGTHKGDNEYYIQHFKEEVLNTLNPKDVIEDLKKLTGVEPHKIILVCYEKPEDFCHRHLVADWLREYREDSRDSFLGYVAEFQLSKEEEKEEAVETPVEEVTDSEDVG